MESCKYRLRTSFTPGLTISNLLDEDDKVIHEKVLNRVLLGIYMSTFEFDDYGPTIYRVYHPQFEYKTKNGRIIRTEVIPSSLSQGIINFYEVKRFLFFFHKKEPIATAGYSLKCKEYLPKLDSFDNLETKEKYKEFIKN